MKTALTHCPHYTPERSQKWDLGAEEISLHSSVREIIFHFHKPMGPVWGNEWEIPRFPAFSPCPSTTTTVRDAVPGVSGSASARDEARKWAAVVTPGTELIAHGLPAIKQCPFLCCVVEHWTELDSYCNAQNILHLPFTPLCSSSSAWLLNNCNNSSWRD